MMDRRELMKRAGMAALVTGLGSAKAFAPGALVMAWLRFLVGSGLVKLHR